MDDVALQGSGDEWSGTDLTVSDPAAGDPGQVSPPEDWTEYADTDGDRAPDAAWGYLTGVGSFTALDPDQDGATDRLEIDTDGDGYVDLVVVAQEGGWLASVDVDRDGVLDSEVFLTAEQLAVELPELLYLLGGGDASAPAEPAPAPEPSAPSDDVAPDDPADPAAPEPQDGGAPDVVDGRIVGDPFAYSETWFNQAFDGSCLPASVAQIYSLYTGEAATDLDFVALVNEVGGWIVGPDGVPGLAPEAAVTLLEEAGIDVSLQTSDLDGLVSALDQGYAVMVAVDSGEYWYGESVEDDQMDHAVLVAGIDVEQGIVYLSDTGTAEGNMLEVPLETFLDAWQDSDNTMVVTEETVAEHRAESGELPADDGTVDDAVADAPAGEVQEEPSSVADVVADRELSPAVSPALLAAVAVAPVILLPVVLRNAVRAARTAR